MRRALQFFILFLALLIITACQAETEEKAEAANVEQAMHEVDSTCLKITSTAFIHEGMIPARYTCDGDDKAPELNWRHVPDNVQSFALICDDPDAPNGTWVHWVLYNIPAQDSCLSMEMNDHPKSHVGGLNSWGTTGYGGPCPPSGTHRYYFRVYALDIILELAPGATKEELLIAMDEHILASGEIMGSYERQN